MAGPRRVHAASISTAGCQ